MWGDDPPFLTVGTEVSAKYKGAFCEAKVSRVVRSIKCKITFKQGLGTLNVTDDQIKGGTLRVGSVCEVKHPEKKEFVEAIINKIQDCSQYTVVFDDGDITTLRRTALCLKSGRHFAESETLDQLPLTHPEHFSNPVIGGRKGRRSRQAQEDSSDEEDLPKKGKKKNEKEADIGKVVCVELGDKKKQKDNWFPGLVVAPTAQDTVRIRVKDEYLVRSFKDGRYFTVPKKEATEFTREIGRKVDNHTLKAAVEKALQYLDRDELPPHWDRDLLFGLDESSGNSNSDEALDSDSSDDEPREEKDHFVAQLYKFMDDRGTPINRGPTIGSRDVDLYKLFKVVHKLGGYNRVTNHNQWKTISQKIGFGQGSSSTTNLVKQSYKKFLHSFEDFYRKLGCTMVNHPRGHRSRHRTGRSLIRDRDRATPTIIPKKEEKKEEKAPPKAEDASSEKKDVFSEKEEESTAEDKKEQPKAKDTAKKNKGREEKAAESQTKQKAKEHAATTAPEAEEKESRNRNKKESKAPVVTKAVEEEAVKEEKSIPLPPVAPAKAEPEATDENKSRETKLKTRDLKPKVKSAEKTKNKEEKPKPPEEEKTEEAKKKIEKKLETEELEKARSKSKEDARKAKEAVPMHDTRAAKDALNRPTRIRKEDEPAPHIKKRGRKRKEMDEKAKADESMGHLASHVAVCVGDKLKVYYGPTHESKVTYEAKVLEIEEDGSECLYLVHYTGWNTRYDEWIKRGRIADNLSWTPTRAKRQRQQQSQHKELRPSQGRRGRPAGSAAGSAPPPPRSSTPSSVTSSSSQNKSPASRSTPRTPRAAADGSDFRRRTRRMSGHTDISVASDSESEEFESDLESEVAQTRSRTTELRKSTSLAFASQMSDTNVTSPDVSIKSEPVTPVAAKEESSPPLTAARKKPDTKVSLQSESSAEGSPVKAETSAKCKVFVEAEKRRSRRGKGTGTGTSPSSTSNAKAASEMRTEASKEDKESCEPKGRDFDLNQIRSELKGIEKAVKLPQDIPAPFCAVEEDNKEKIKSSLIDWDISERTTNELKVKPKKEIEDEKPEKKMLIKEVEEAAVDVYEFTEAEPLELEVRKRDPLSLGDSKSLSRRTGSSVRHLESFPFESSISTSSSLTVSSRGHLVGAKSPRKRLINTSPKDTETTSEVGKKLRGAAKKKVPVVEVKQSTSQAPTEKVEPLSARSVKSSAGKTEHILEDICSPSLLPTASTLVSGPQQAHPQSTSALGRLQTSSLEVDPLTADDNPCSPPLLSLPECEDTGEAANEVDSGMVTSIGQKSPQLGPLSIFSDNHDDGDDDHEDRLIISESDEMVTESAEPLFSYQQRDHEDLFPTLVTSAAVVTAVPSSSAMKAVDSPCLSSVEVTPTIFHDFGSAILESSQQSSLQKRAAGGRAASHILSPAGGRVGDDDDVIKDLLDQQHVDYGDDSINADICRELDRSIMDEDEDTSGDMELFCGKQMAGISPPRVGMSMPFPSAPVSGASPKHSEHTRPLGQHLSHSFNDSDSQSESSDEEDQRLVIDPAEDEDDSPTRDSPFTVQLNADDEPLQETSPEAEALARGGGERVKKTEAADVMPTVIVSCAQVNTTLVVQESSCSMSGTLAESPNDSDVLESATKDSNEDEDVDEEGEEESGVKLRPLKKEAVKAPWSKQELRADSIYRRSPVNTPVIVKMNLDSTQATTEMSFSIHDGKNISLKEEVPVTLSTNIISSASIKAPDSANNTLDIRALPTSVAAKDFLKVSSRGCSAVSPPLAASVMAPQLTVVSTTSSSSLTSPEPEHSLESSADVGGKKTASEAAGAILSSGSLTSANSITSEKIVASTKPASVVTAVSTCAVTSTAVAYPYGSAVGNTARPSADPLPMIVTATPVVSTCPTVTSDSSVLSTSITSSCPVIPPVLGITVTPATCASTVATVCAAMSLSSFVSAAPVAAVSAISSVSDVGSSALVALSSAIPTFSIVASSPVAGDVSVPSVSSVAVAKMSPVASASETSLAACVVTSTLTSVVASSATRWRTVHTTSSASTSSSSVMAAAVAASSASASTTTSTTSTTTTSTTSTTTCAAATTAIATAIATAACSVTACVTSSTATPPSTTDVKASGERESTACMMTPSNTPVTILLGTSTSSSAISSDYSFMIAGNSNESTTSSSSPTTGEGGDFSTTSSVTGVSRCSCSPLVSPSVSTSVTNIPAAVVSSPVFQSSSQQNSNLKLMCDAIKHSDSSVIALTSLSLGESEIISGDIRLDTRSDDADSQLLGSLLCQETIPGSPAQMGDGAYEDSVQESKVLVLEMPFASVPASSCDAGSTSVPLPIVNVTTLSESKTTENMDEDQPSAVEMPSAVSSAAGDKPSPEVVTCPPHHVLVIPSASASKINSSEAAPVLENTPPTTPDSSLSTISGSPREDHRALSPGLDNESSKSHRDSFEMDLDSCPEDSLLNVEVSNSCNNRLQGLDLLSKKCVLDLEKECETSPKKRRRSRKRSESENLKRARCSNKNLRPSGGTGSDSDDTSENSALDCTPLASSESTLSSKSPRPSKYNFYVELDPELDGSQRIALLQQKLQELRKTYMNVKAELACIDRRRKKLRRREREEKTSKQEVSCS